MGNKDEIIKKLTELLCEYFSVDVDCYTYNLTRCKSAFAVGTVKLDDFEEVDEEQMCDLAEWLLEHGLVGVIMEAVDAEPVRHGKPAPKKRPQRYYYYEDSGITDNGETLYKMKSTFNENETVDYCSECGKRLCSRFTNYCPSCGAVIEMETTG